MSFPPFIQPWAADTLLAKAVGVPFALINNTARVPPCRPFCPGPGSGDRFNSASRCMSAPQLALGGRLQWNRIGVTATAGLAATTASLN